MILYRDTREQKVLEFEVGNGISQVIDTKLPYGDYAAAWEDKNGNHIAFMPIFWDRKGLGDLFGTLTSGSERFKREINRAKEDGVSLKIIIEGCRREVEMGYEYSTISGKTILKTLDTLHVKYGIEHVFCNDRSDMVKTIVSKFEAIGRNFKPKQTKMGDMGVALEKRKQMEEVQCVENSEGDEVESDENDVKTGISD